MGLLDYGCTCKACTEIKRKDLQNARDRWNKGEREIKFVPYHYECGDGCCSDYGTNAYVNGFELNCDGEDVESVLGSLFEFLNIKGVSVEYEYNDYAY